MTASACLAACSASSNPLVFALRLSQPLACKIRVAGETICLSPFETLMTFTSCSAMLAASILMNAESAGAWNATSSFVAS